jgi:hypothetical protein
MGSSKAKLSYNVSFSVDATFEFSSIESLQRLMDELDDIATKIKHADESVEVRYYFSDLSVYEVTEDDEQVLEESFSSEAPPSSHPSLFPKLQSAIRLLLVPFGVRLPVAQESETEKKRS